jgi:hypothetical protein
METDRTAIVTGSTVTGLNARDCGRTCAVAGQVQRELLSHVAGYAELFPAPPFDQTFYSTITLANTFCAPWLSAAELRLTMRITLWVFALDHLMDRVAADRTAVDDIARRCLAVAAGAAPEAGDALGRLLAEIRDELADSPTYGRLADAWRDEVGRMLATMAREWAWKAARETDPDAPWPSLDAYLDSAETGFALVFVTHWIATTDAGLIGEVPALRAAARAVERVTSLLNDLGSYRRDLRTGDLNALLLGASRAEVEERLADLVTHARALLAPLATGPHRPLALFLDRHLDFNTGFYLVTDYQAEP